MTAEKSRSSQYLVEKCLALRQALEFFSKSGGRAGHGVEDRLMVFLAQIDFWEWEVDNLVYSFTTFCERQDAWEDPTKAIRLKGFACRPRCVAKASWANYARRYSGRVTEVTAPLDALNDCLKQWDSILTECKERVLSEQRIEQYRNIGASLVSIEKYRKGRMNLEDLLPPEKEPGPMDGMTDPRPGF